MRVIPTGRRSAAFATFVLGTLATLLGCRERRTGDLPAMREAGVVRILAPRLREPEVLPRQGYPLEFGQDLAAAFARSAGLQPVFVYVDRYEDLIPALLDGRGDMVAASLAETPERTARVAFSAPVGHVIQQVVTRAADTTLTKPADLAGRTVVVRRSSSYWDTLQRLRQQVPALQVIAAPEDLDTEDILYRVSQGAYDVTIADDNLVNEAQAYMPGLRVAFDATDRQGVAWALRPDAPRLLAAVDSFLEQAALGGRRPERDRLDLAGIRRRGVIRMITRNSAATYFIWRGKLVGFEYELAHRFAQRLGLRLEVVMAPDRASLLGWLRQGRGDFVAAGLTITPGREATGIAFSRPYNYVREMVVGRLADSTLTRPAQLAGRTVVVRRSSSYWPTLEALRKRGVRLRLEAAPEELETEEIIDSVAAGAYDLTVADSHILAIERSWRNDVQGLMALTDSVPHGWAVRDDQPRLLAAIDTFMHRSYRGRFYNLLYQRYFQNTTQIREQAAGRPTRTGRISPYDSLFQAYSNAYAFDWRLIAAQSYQESRFNPRARSFAGALGLMQVLPRTARELGIDSLRIPAHGIQAGVMYMDWLRERLPDSVTGGDRLWLALAAYNAGWGHLMDARRLARRLGRDPDTWFGSLDAVMPLLARSRYHSRARYGYCHCAQPVAYVRDIRAQFQAYVAATANVASSTTDH
ncbi:MAG TPA: transporter substrate-binding domain-containing protein [Longimicrobiales bacterium]|nr:transporter substrate-binding domain-containing protein [Longimicrobiales bacterium]